MTTAMFNQQEDMQQLLGKRTPCEVWTRVMGYHRPVTQFNHGKKSEFYSRTYFEEQPTMVSCSSAHTL